MDFMTEMSNIDVLIKINKIQSAIS